MIETADLILKKACFEDWQDLYTNVWSHAETARYMLWDVTGSEEAAMARMDRTIAWQANHSAWTVYDKKTCKAIGFAGLIEIQPGVWEDTGVALGPSYTGKGYGKQILKRLIQYVFEEKNGKTLICSCRSENTASRRVILSCGLHYTHSENRIDQRNDKPYALESYRIDG